MGFQPTMGHARIAAGRLGAARHYPAKACARSDNSSKYQEKGRHLLHAQPLFGDGLEHACAGVRCRSGVWRLAQNNQGKSRQHGDRQAALLRHALVQCARPCMAAAIQTNSAGTQHWVGTLDCLPVGSLPIRHQPATPPCPALTRPPTRDEPAAALTDRHLWRIDHLQGYPAETQVGSRV